MTTSTLELTNKPGRRSASFCYDALARGDWNGETVLALGRVQVDPKIPGDHVISISRPEAVNPVKLVDRLPEEHWDRPLCMVLPREAGPDQGRAARRLQMRVLWRRYHGVFNQWAVQTNPEPVRPLLRGLKDPSRSLHQLGNYPWLLRYPLADQLAGTRPRVPVLILVGGPSLNNILPRLPELAVHCAVICIARTLRPCLEAGVEPDFVVQYDTNPEQAQFYEGLPRLERTTLVALSTAHVRPYADLFRGMLFRGSFGKKFLPNTYMMREGVESSLIACLGLAEVLHAPQVFVAGTDLSWPVGGWRYGEQPSGEQGRDTLPAGDQRVFPHAGMNVRLRRRDGLTVESNWNFVAAAVKAGDAAREIAAELGTAFHALGDETLLEEDVFPTAGREDVSALPALDRPALLECVDQALNVREEIHLDELFDYLKTGEQKLSSMGDLFMLRRMDPAERPKLRNDLFVRMLQNFRGACWMRGMNDPVEAAGRFIRLWQQRHAEAAKLTLAHMLVNKGLPLPLLCRADEQPGLQRALERYIPGGQYNVRLVVPFGKKKTSATEFDDLDLPALLEGYGLVLVSPAVRERYQYFWALAPDEKVICLDWFACP